MSLISFPKSKIESFQKQFTDNIFRCPECNIISILSPKYSNGLNINYNCSNNHKGVLKYEDFLSKSLNHSIFNNNCKQCSKNLNENCILENFYCISCNNFYCLNCLKEFHNKENKEHEYFNIQNFDSRCFKHNKNFYSFCKQCLKNLCIECLNEHSGHEIISFNHENFHFNNEIDEKINKINENLKIVENITNKMIENFQEKIDILKKSLNDYQSIITNEIKFINYLKFNYLVLKKQENYNFEYIFNLQKYNNIIPSIPFCNSLDEEQNYYNLKNFLENGIKKTCPNNLNILTQIDIQNNNKIDKINNDIENNNINNNNLFNNNNIFRNSDNNDKFNNNNKSIFNNNNILFNNKNDLNSHNRQNLFNNNNNFSSLFGNSNDKNNNNNNILFDNSNNNNNNKNNNNKNINIKIKNIINLNQNYLAIISKNKIEFYNKFSLKKLEKFHEYKYDIIKSFSFNNEILYNSTNNNEIKIIELDLPNNIKESNFLNNENNIFINDIIEIINKNLILLSNSNLYLIKKNISSEYFIDKKFNINNNNNNNFINSNLIEIDSNNVVYFSKLNQEININIIDINSMKINSKIFYGKIYSNENNNIIKCSLLNKEIIALIDFNNINLFSIKNNYNLIKNMNINVNNLFCLSNGLILGYDDYKIKFFKLKKNDLVNVGNDGINIYNKKIISIFELSYEKYLVAYEDMLFVVN